MDQQYSFAADTSALLAKANQIGEALNHTELTIAHLIAAITSISNAAYHFDGLRLKGSTKPLNSERARQAAFYLLTDADAHAGEQAQRMRTSTTVQNIFRLAGTFASERAPKHPRIELADILKAMTETELADEFRYLLLGDLSSHAPVELRLGQQPAAIRDTARALAWELRAQIEQLRRSTPNDPDRLIQHNGLVDFLERMAAGLGRLADTLDLAVIRASDGKPEPVFLGEAAKITRQLHLSLMEWLETNVDVPARMTFYGLGVSLLHFMGADSTAAIAGLTALALRPPPKKKDRAKPTGKKKLPFGNKPAARR